MVDKRKYTLNNGATNVVITVYSLATGLQMVNQSLNKEYLSL